MEEIILKQLEGSIQAANNAEFTSRLAIILAIAGAILGPIVAWIVTDKKIRSESSIATQQLRSTADIAKKQINTSLISKNRQEWMENVRNEVVWYLKSGFPIYWISLNKEKFDPHVENVIKFTRPLLEHLYRIELLLDPAIDTHKDLLSSVYWYYKVNNALLSSNGDVNMERYLEDLQQAREDVTNKARQFLIKEWKKVTKWE